MKVELAKAKLAEALSGPMATYWKYTTAVSAVLAALERAEKEAKNAQLVISFLDCMDTPRVADGRELLLVERVRSYGSIRQNDGYQLGKSEAKPLTTASPVPDADYYRSILGQIADESVALRAGGPAPEDLHSLSEALQKVISLAYQAYATAPKIKP